MTRNNVYYLYGIIKNMPLQDTIPGIDRGGKVSAIAFNEIAGVVSSVNLDEFGEAPLKQNLESLDWVKDKVFSHERVVEAVMKDTTIIPMKFCTIFNTTERVLSLLEEKYGAFVKLLETYSNKHEWGVKVYCSKNLMGNVPATVPSRGREYLMNRKAQQDMQLKNERKINALVTKIFEKIKSLAEDSRINRSTPKELLPYKDKEQLLNASFLMGEANEKKLPALVQELSEEHKENFLLEVTGPLPIYSFIASDLGGISNANNK